MAVTQHVTHKPLEIRAMLQRHPLVGLIAGIILLVGAVLVMESLRADDATVDSSVVSLTGVVGGVTPRIGDLAPDFSLASTDGASVSLADLRGRPVFVNFWATWCPPCRGEMPDISQVAEENRDTGLVVLGVNLQEEREPVVHYAQTLGLTFTLLLDRSGAVATRYNVTGLPTSYFIDRDGRIRDRNVGPLTPKGLRSKVAKVVQ